MRFHTSHLLSAVFAAGFVLALSRHPEALWAAVVVLVGGLFVVLPVLGTVEALSSRDSTTPEVGWLGGCLALLVGAIGILTALACLYALEQVISG